MQRFSVGGGLGKYAHCEEVEETGPVNFRLAPDWSDTETGIGGVI